MFDPGSQRISQMCFRQRYEPVETLATYRPDYALAEAVRHWTARRRFQSTQPEAADRGVELPREDAVAVMKQITVVGVKSEGLAQLLARPGRCRVRRLEGETSSPVQDPDEMNSIRPYRVIDSVAAAAVRLWWALSRSHCFVCTVV
jgi:hypothetical protein